MGLVLLLVTLPPFVAPEWRIVLMQVFAPVCHQIAERSFHVGGVALAACHRCYGIYWGLFLGPVIYLVARRREYSRLLLWLGLLPLGLDWTLDAVALWHNTPLSRMFTGGVFGVVAGLFVAQALCGGVPAARQRSGSSRHAAVAARLAHGAGWKGTHGPSHRSLK